MRRWGCGRRLGCVKEGERTSFGVWASQPVQALSRGVCSPRRRNLLLAHPLFCPFVFAARSGYLVSVDAYMNLQLASTEEYVDNKLTGTLGEVFIRCNNVLYIRGAPDEMDGDGVVDTEDA